MTRKANIDAAGTGDGRVAIRRVHRLEEHVCVLALMERASLDEDQQHSVQVQATALAEGARNWLARQGGVDAFMVEYDLSSQEGVLLMCLAEALLRIPDSETADRLIRDRLGKGQWDGHLGRSGSLLVNASTWGLLLTGQLVQLEPATDPLGLLQKLVARSGERVVHLALRQAMALMAQRFVLGRTLEGAQARRREYPDQARFSFDCLGEAAHTEADAERYFQAYRDAIRLLGEREDGDLLARSSVSIKLSALHPRYEYLQRQRVMNELGPRLQALVELARSLNVPVTLDAEEADRLELSLDLFETVSASAALDGWDGLGLAVQAYQKRALPVLQWLVEQARQQQRRIPVRLVKGAYWDTEIKRAQERGLDGYPVFTRKAATDMSYLACARFMLEHNAEFYPQFATHNAHTVAWLLEAGRGREFEFQRLHGMGDGLYASLAEQCELPVHVRVYAPVGSHEELLPYLVRRLLENGANTSFVNQLGRADRGVDELVADPLALLEDVGTGPAIPLPLNLYGDERGNARGFDLADPDVVGSLVDEGPRDDGAPVAVAARVGGKECGDAPHAIRNPANGNQVVGEVREAGTADVDEAMQLAAAAQPGWDAAGGASRADCLARAADGIEAQAVPLAWRVVREGGRTLPDALAEVREAADFCRYYAARARAEFTEPQVLPGPTGELNQLALHGRGVFACISPWNFPLAIFTGQVAAALAAGNSVLAKPARQTPLVAAAVVDILQESGVPPDVLHFLPGSGAALGGRIVAARELGGIAFTGSTATARQLQRGLAARDGPIVPLIAETGGQNVMIADSSALPEQLVGDVLQSVFNSAGQRCSALRVLFVQEEIADPVIDMLAGAMDQLTIGDPARLDTDVGPVIDAAALAGLVAHRERMAAQARSLKMMAVPGGLEGGHFFGPCMFELPDLSLLGEEVFGPVLHLVRYPANGLDQVMDQVNATGYGLTLGVHSRIEATWEAVRARARVGNLYINRNMIGAVVGVQPFGGEGLSGTGPKAGGPRYLHRFATERTLTINTAAVGGNIELLSRED